MNDRSSQDSAASGEVSRQQRRARERARRKAEGSASPAGKILASGAALTLGVLGFGQAAEAATFTVTNLNDAGPGSLRQALSDANGATGPDVVTFQAGVTGTINLTTGQLAILDSVDLQGPGQSVVTVNGGGSSRVFYVYSPAATPIDVTISGLTVTGGSAPVGAGLVDFDENLTLDHMTFDKNSASGIGGGLAAGGLDYKITVTNSIFSGNTAVNGGGIYIYDIGQPMLIQDTVVTGNQATGQGGGIYFYGPNYDVTIDRSTFTNNHADGRGGGIYFYDTDGGAVLIKNTTVSGNTAAFGAGIYLYAFDDPLTIENSTITGNQALYSGGGICLYVVNVSADIHNSTIAGNTAGTYGGGIYVYNPSYVTIENSIIADNAAPSGNDLYGGGTTFGLSYTLVEDPGGAGITDNGGNLFNQDPQLGPLGNHGGPTQTLLPASTSPVINAGDPAFTPPPSTDQRGFARVVGGRLDMGAVELAPGVLQFAVATDSVAESAGTVTITATRTGGSDGAVSVAYNNADGTATAPADYAAAGGTLNWADQDAASKTFQVTIVNDTLDEPDETFTENLSAPTGGAALGANTVETVTIQDDDVAGTLQFAVSAVTVAENAITVTITVTRTGGADGAVSVTYNTADGTAVAPGDYLAASGTLNWADQDAAPKTFQVTIVNDAIIEPNETFTITLSNPQGSGAALGSTVVETVTIQDDDTPPIPTLGDMGKVLLSGLVAGAGFLVLRRRRLAAPLVALALALGGTAAGFAAPVAKEVKAVSLSQVSMTGATATLKLSDGSTLVVPMADLEIRDRRHHGKAAGARLPAGSLHAGQPAVVKVKLDHDGALKRVKVVLFDTIQAAQKAVARNKGA